VANLEKSEAAGTYPEDRAVDIYTEEWQTARWDELNEKRDELVTFLVGWLRGNPVLPDIRARVAEQPHGAWLRGRPDAECWFCEGTGEYARLKPEVVQRLQDQREKSYVVGPSDIQAIEEARKDPANCNPPEPCPICKGTKRAQEQGLHFGWGMGFRNLLRSSGYPESEMGIENWDDYYAVVLEKALAKLGA